jgi:DinB superfamily
MGAELVNILRPNGLLTALLERALAGLKERLMKVTSHELTVQVAINSWRLVLERTNKTLSSLADDQLLKEVAPGKNRVIYLWGHLIAVHDAMFPILGLGERLHPELDAIFISSPDGGAQLPPVGELRKYWDEVNGKLLSQFGSLSQDEWLQRHRSVSEEDYAKDPTRNRLTVLLSRTNHMSYHLGQMILALK